jgi:hypothetical protein
MKTEAIWGCECQRYFVPTEKTNSKGNPITMPIEVRKLWLRGRFLARQGDNSHITDTFQVNLIRRKGQNLYCIKFKKSPDRWWHDKTPIHESEYKWVKQETLGRDAFLAWLKFHVVNPLAVVVELETCPPETETKVAA